MKIRSQHEKARATLTTGEAGEVEIIFDEPVEAVTLGQGAAIYDREKLLGGGWIDSLL